MLFMNDFLQQHWEGMRSFLQTVSSPDIEIPMTSFDGYVDLPLRLAVLHGLLVDIISPMEQVGVKYHNMSSLACSLVTTIDEDTDEGLGRNVCAFSPSLCCNRIYATKNCILESF